jgi:hypothetical protein
MPDDLIVGQGTIVTLEENPRGGILEAAHQRVRLDTLSDLVREEIVSSDAVLNHLLEAAKTATKEALTSRSTFTPFVPVRGTTRPDLRRLGSFLVASPDATPLEQTIFWRLARGVSATTVANLTVSTRLTDVGVLHPVDVSKFVFKDVTVETNGLLQVVGDQIIYATHLLIQRGGRIVGSGSGFQIKARSIQGEQ